MSLSGKERELLETWTYSDPHDITLQGLEMSGSTLSKSTIKTKTMIFFSLFLSQVTDARARQRRKALVKKIQQLMEQCDRVQDNINQLMVKYT